MANHRPTFAVKVAKQEAIRLLGEAMRRKQAEFAVTKAEYKERIKEIDKEDKDNWEKFQQRVAKSKKADELEGHYPKKLYRPPEPTISLCDEKQLLTMLRADTRDVIPVPEGSLLWTLIQGKCTPIK